MTPQELTAWRKSMNLNQTDFARDYLPKRLTVGTISAWETGKRPIPFWLAAVKQVMDQNEAAGESWPEA